MESSKNKKQIDIQIMETMNDLFEAGVTDDKLAILYEANKEIDVAVNTPKWPDS